MPRPDPCRNMCKCANVRMSPHLRMCRDLGRNRGPSGVAEWVSDVQMCVRCADLGVKREMRGCVAYRVMCECEAQQQAHYLRCGVSSRDSCVQMW